MIFSGVSTGASSGLSGWHGVMLYGFEGNSGTFVADPLNLFPIPVTRVAAYCATGIEGA